MRGSFRCCQRAWAISHAKRPLILLGAVVATSGVFSAFLVNDTIGVVLTLFVLELTVALGRKPAPYLLALAMASTRPWTPPKSLPSAQTRRKTCPLPRSRNRSTRAPSQW